MGYRNQFGLILLGILAFGACRSQQMQKDPETLEDICAIKENQKYLICKEHLGLE